MTTLSIQDLAQRWRVSKRTVMRLYGSDIPKHRRLKRVKVGHATRFNERDVVRFEGRVEQ